MDQVNLVNLKTYITAKSMSTSLDVNPNLRFLTYLNKYLHKNVPPFRKTHKMRVKFSFFVSSQ